MFPLTQNLVSVLILKVVIIGKELALEEGLKNHKSQKGKKERWYISSVGPTLYRDGLERLIFSCSHCFLSFYMLPRNDADVEI